MKMERTTNLNPVIIPLMAVSAGIIVANIYYNQPILKEMGMAVNTSESAIGRIAMLSQLGYGLGMFFLLPLGDKLNRKRLIVGLSFLLLLTLILVAVSH